MAQIEQDRNRDQIEGHYKKHIEREYLGAYDLSKKDGTYGSAAVKIAAVYQRKVYDKKTQTHHLKVILALEGKEKLFILNIENMDTIASIAKTDMVEKWVGTEFKLVVKSVRAGPKMVDALRVSRI